MIVPICELGGGSCKEDYPLPSAYEGFGADPERRSATRMSMPYAMQMVKAEKKRRGQSGPPPTSPPEEPSTTSASFASDQSPMMYNSKMMNSIWGMYNKYSVHNFKSKLCDGTQAPAGNENGMAEMFGGQSQASLPEPSLLANVHDMFKFHH